MCTKEEVAVEIKKLKEELPAIIDDRLLQFLPQAIGKGIKEAGAHLTMSAETRCLFDEHSKRIKNVEDMIEKSMSFHERIEPILEGVEPLLARIQKADELRKGSMSILSTTAKICGYLAIIGGFITSLFWVLHTLA